MPVLFMLFLGVPLALTSFGIIYITLALDIIIFSLIFEKEELDVSFRNPRRKDRVFEDAKSFLKCLLINGGFAASCGLVLLCNIKIIDKLCSSDVLFGISSLRVVWINLSDFIFK